MYLVISFLAFYWEIHLANFSFMDLRTPCFIHDQF